MEDRIRRRDLLWTAVPGAIAGKPEAAAPAGESGVFDVRRFGAAGDGKRLDTAAIQAAVDACSKVGGGTVVLPDGEYLSGTIVLRSRVTLRLPAGSRLKGSARLEDYPPMVPAYRSYTDNYTEKSLLYAEKAEAVALEGSGTIDGQGSAFKGPYKVRPYLMRFIECRNVTVRDLRIENSPMWVQHYLACDDVRLSGLTVQSRVNQNNDGIDIDSCRGVRISDCDISSGDDAICLKSTSDRPCRDVVISNCVVSSLCNAFKMGTESNGGFENIAISNCTVYETRLAGLALEIVDGGTLRGVTISNIAMRGAGSAIFVRLGDRGRPFREGGPRPAIGALEGVLIQGVHATGAGRIGCALAGLPGHPITGITLRDVAIASQGGGNRADAEREIPEHADKYPEHSMFGVLPAYGFYIRHAKEVCLEGVACSVTGADLRPALLCDDVEGLDIGRFRAEAQPESEPPLRLVNVRQAMVRGCRAGAIPGAFLRIDGDRTAGIVLDGNDLAAAGKPCLVSAGVPAGAIAIR